MSMQTFSVPTGTAVIGMIAAILGLDKNTYWNSFPKDSYQLAIGIRNPIKKVWIPFNTLKVTSPSHFFDYKDHKRSNMEFIKDSKFRIWFSSSNKELMKGLITLLENHQSVYSFSLGLAWCLGDFEYIDTCSSIQKGNAQENDTNQEQNLLFPKKDKTEIHSIIPKQCLLDISFDNRRIFSNKLPIAMKDNSRILSSVLDCIFETTGKSIFAKVSSSIKLSNGDCIVPLC